jgi:hypothetical protein
MQEGPRTNVIFYSFYAPRDGLRVARDFGGHILKAPFAISMLLNAFLQLVLIGDRNALKIEQQDNIQMPFFRYHLTCRFWEKRCRLRASLHE